MLKGWQAVPAAFLAVYLLIGLVVATLTSLLSQPNVLHDWLTENRILYLSSQVARYALPAALLGGVVGWATACSVSRMPRPMRYVAYVVLAAVFLPAVVSIYDSIPGLKLFPFSIYFHSITRQSAELFDIRLTTDVVRLLLLATAASVWTFLIMTFRYSLDPRDRIRTQSPESDGAASSTTRVLAGSRGDRAVLWVVLSFVASLGLLFLTMLLVTSDEILSRQGNMGVFPYVDVDFPNRLMGSHCAILPRPAWCDPPYWQGKILQWQNWMPAVIVLLVLASTIMMSMWLASMLRGKAENHSQAVSDSTTDAPPYPFPWLTTSIAAAIAIVVVVLSGFSGAAIVAGAFVGTGLAALGHLRSPVNLTLLAAIVGATIAFCSFGMWMGLGMSQEYHFHPRHLVVAIPFLIGAFGSVFVATTESSQSRTINILFRVFVPAVSASLCGVLFVALTESFSWIDIVFTTLIVGGATSVFIGVLGGILFVATKHPHRKTFKYSLYMILAVPISLGVYAIISVLNVELKTRQFDSVFGVTATTSRLELPFLNAHLVYVMAALVIILSLALFVSLRSSVRDGLNVVVCGLVGFFLLVLLGISGPKFDFVFDVYYSEHVRSLRDFLLALTVAYVWLSTVGPPGPSKSGRQDRPWSFRKGLSSHLPGISVAAAVAVASACVVYIIVLVMLYGDSGPRILEALAYGPWPDGLPRSRLGYWLLLYAYTVESCALLALAGCGRIGSDGAIG